MRNRWQFGWLSGVLVLMAAAACNPFAPALEEGDPFGSFLGDPTTMTEGPSAGETWVYFLAPWGMQLELVSYPDGKAYEGAFDGRLWDPRS